MLCKLSRGRETRGLNKRWGWKYFQNLAKSELSFASPKNDIRQSFLVKEILSFGKQKNVYFQGKVLIYDFLEIYKRCVLINSRERVAKMPNINKRPPFIKNLRALL